MTIKFTKIVHIIVHQCPMFLIKIYHGVHMLILNFIMNNPALCLMQNRCNMYSTLKNVRALMWLSVILYYVHRCSIAGPEFKLWNSSPLNCNKSNVERDNAYSAIQREVTLLVYQHRFKSLSECTGQIFSSIK